MESNQIQQQKPDANHALKSVELSEREREILALVASGASNKEVALKLVISPNTVKVHLRNIFGKIGVSSRTEAALYAVRAGLVHVAVDAPATEADAGNLTETAGSEASPTNVLAAPSPAAEQRAVPLLATRPRVRPAVWLMGAVLVMLMAIVVALVLPRLRPAEPTVMPTAIMFTNPPRWEVRTAMPAVRSRLAATTYENQVYAIAGETAEGVSTLTQRYNPTKDAWTTLSEKPVAVADVGAAVVGGLIYVPGGRVATGAVTTTVEAYDPSTDEWVTRAPLPVALSGYALSSFEGRLYLFGGWNGSDYVASVYEYDPAADTWTERTRMPTARGFAAAAPAGGKIFVLGGTDAKGASQATEAYVPARDSDVANPWESLAPAPDGHSLLGAATIADTLYVAGRNEATGSIAAWSMRPTNNNWEPLESVADGFAPDWLTMVAVQTHIYVLGGHQGSGTPGQLVAYQALYTSLIPVISDGK